MKELNQSEQDYIKAYLSNGGNCTDAFLTIRPHVKRDTARIEGSRMKRRPHVSAALQEHNSTQLAVVQDKAILSKNDLLGHTKWGIEAAREDRELGSLFKGIDTAAKLTGSYSQEEDDESKYVQFMQKITVNLTINSQETSKNVIDITPDDGPASSCSQPIEADCEEGTT